MAWATLDHPESGAVPHPSTKAVVPGPDGTDYSPRETHEQLARPRTPRPPAEFSAAEPTQEPARVPAPRRTLRSTRISLGRWGKVAVAAGILIVGAIGAVELLTRPGQSASRSEMERYAAAAAGDAQMLLRQYGTTSGEKEAA